MNKFVISFVLLFLFSCGDAGNQLINTEIDPLEKRFKLIEGKLKNFADKYDAEISTVWSKIQKQDPYIPDSFLVKHIVWNDGRIGKAIFIQQHNDIEGVDTTKWDILNIAWLQDTQLTAKPTLVKNLLTNVDFKIIEKDIDRLLKESEKHLNVVTIKDLK